MLYMRCFIFSFVMLFLGCTHIPNVSFYEVLKAETGGGLFQGLDLYSIQDKRRMKKAEFIRIKNGKESIVQRSYYKNGLLVEADLLGGDATGKELRTYTADNQILTETLSFDGQRGFTQIKKYEYSSDDMRFVFIDERLEYKEILSSLKNTIFLTREYQDGRNKKEFKIVYKNGMVQEWYTGNNKFVFEYSGRKIKKLLKYVQTKFGDNLLSWYEVFYEDNYISEVVLYDFIQKTRDSQLVRREFYKNYYSNGNWTEYMVMDKNGEIKPYFKRVFEYEK